MPRSAASISLLWLLGSALLGWARFPAAWRRRTALASGLAGLVFLVIAVNTEGSREAPTVAVFLMGTPYVTATAQALASLPFYLMSGTLLLLGFAGLAVGEGTAAWLARHWLATAVLLSLAITALRFALEKTAAPPFLSHLVGVTWLAPVVGAFFGWSARSEGRGLLAVVRALAAYAIAVRGAVLLFMLVATSRGLGSHYDVTPVTLVHNPLTGQTYQFEPGSLTQFVGLAVLPQVAIWPLYTVATGLVGAGVVWVLGASWRASTRDAPAETSASPQPESAPRQGGEEAISARGRS